MPPVAGRCVRNLNVDMTDPIPGAAMPPPPKRPALTLQFVILLCLAMGPAAVIGFFESLSTLQRQHQRTEEALLQDAMISVLADREVIAGARVLLESLVEQETVKDAQQPACSVVLRTAITRSRTFE